MDKNFDRPDFLKFEAPPVEGLPYRQETCRASPSLLVCVLKRLIILIKFTHRGPGGKNGPKF